MRGARDGGSEGTDGGSVRPHEALDATPRTGAGRLINPWTWRLQCRYSEQELADRDDVIDGC